jgi:predicted Zn-ribbon and HTH transcriptional regulator
MKRGNPRVQAEAQDIARRLRETDVTLAQLVKEYRCAYESLTRALIPGQMSKEEFQSLMKKRMGRPNAGRFVPGHDTWNAGKKGWHAPGCEKTWFRPGEIRGASARKYRPVGSVTLRYDRPKGAYKRRVPYRWIKVQDEGPLFKRYVPLARYLWEQHHGRKVSEGMFVVHANGDTLDDVPVNLILVDLRENMRRLYEHPEVIAKCRAKAGRSAKKRHAENRAAREEKKARRKLAQTFWECDACGHEFGTAVTKCPKCGSYSIVRRILDQIPESMVLEAIEREAV